MNCPAPSLRPHYRALTATTGRSAPVPRIGTLPLAVFAACGSPSCGQKHRPSLSGRQVLLFHASACDELTPPIHRAPSGPHTGSSPTEGPPRRAFVPGPPTDPGFDAIVVSFRCVSSGSHMFVFSSHTRPANSETSPAALTTPALNRRSLRWFGISACTATPGGPTPITGTARIVPTIFYIIIITSPSGHTWVPETLSWLGQAACLYSLMRPSQRVVRTSRRGSGWSVVLSSGVVCRGGRCSSERCGR